MIFVIPLLSQGMRKAPMTKLLKISRLRGIFERLYHKSLQFSSAYVKLKEEMIRN